MSMRWKMDIVKRLRTSAKTSEANLTGLQMTNVHMSVRDAKALADLVEAADECLYWNVESCKLDAHRKAFEIAAGTEDAHTRLESALNKLGRYGDAPPDNALARLKGEALEDSDD